MSAPTPFTHYKVRRPKTQPAVIPAGSGKTSALAELLERFPNMRVHVVSLKRGRK